MTLLHMDGFELSDIASRYGNSLPTTSTNATRFSYGRKVFTGTGSNVFKSFTAANPIITGFANRDLSDGPAYATFYGDGGATQHITVLFDQTTKLISVRRGSTSGTLLGSTAALTSGWHYYEIKVTIGDGTAGSVIVKKNGVEIINTGGVDTKNGGTNSSIDRVGLGASGAGSSAEWDDWYILDTSGSYNNDFLGDVRIAALAPNGNGTNSDFLGSDGNSTDNYLLVDEQPPTLSGDNISSSTIGHKDLYTMSDLPANTTTVFAAQEFVIAGKDNAGPASIKTLVRTASTNYSSSAVAVGGGPQLITNIRETNPNTGVAWTPSDIDGLEVGVEVA